MASGPPTLPAAPWGPLVVAPLIGAAGGALFWWLTLPLPWMLGSMVAVTVAALSGVKVHLPPWVRSVMITVIGVMLGASFTPAAIARMGQWLVTLAGLAACSAALGLVGWVWFRHVAKFDPVTAYFSAAPGGLNEMVLVGGAMGGDDRTIALVHATRVFLVVFTIPVWYRFHGAPLGGSGGRPFVGLTEIAWIDVAILAACAIVGAPLARRLKVPAAFLLGPMALSAAVHLTGATGSSPPTLLVSAAQVAIGTTLGCRFSGTPLGLIGRTLRHAAAAAVLLIAITVGFAVVVDRFVDLPLAALILAYAPGGLPEMSLLAFALAIDAAFVAAHHLARLIMVITIAPLFFRVLGRKP